MIDIARAMQTFVQKSTSLATNQRNGNLSLLSQVHASSRQHCVAIMAEPRPAIVWPEEIQG